MFDIGGWEFLIVIVIAIIVIGPKDLPGAIRTVTGWVRRARELAREFQSGIDDLAREVDLDNVKNEIQTDLGLNDLTESGNTIRNRIENTIDPDGTIEKAFNDDKQDAEDDGPFADNTFEEDEDIDGAGSGETDKRDTGAPEHATDEPPEGQEIVAAEKQDDDRSDERKEAAGQTVQKTKP